MFSLEDEDGSEGSLISLFNRQTEFWHSFLVGLSEKEIKTRPEERGGG